MTGTPLKKPFGMSIERQERGVLLVQVLRCDVTRALGISFGAPGAMVSILIIALCSIARAKFRALSYA